MESFPPCVVKKNRLHREGKLRYRNSWIMNDEDMTKFKDDFRV